MENVKTKRGNCIKSAIKLFTIQIIVMVQHLLKLIWNKKKQNSLLLSEIFISFLVIFAVFTLMVYFYRNYKKPMGIDYENVWVVNYSNSFKTENKDSLNTFYEAFRQTIKSLPDVKELSFCSDNVPFSNNSWQNGFKHNGREIKSVNWFVAEDSYKDVLNIKLLDGRWFSRQDIVSKIKPVVINNSLKENVFGKENAVGKTLGDDDRKMKVIGVIEDVKIKGDYAIAGNAVYDRADSNSFSWFGKILVKVSPDADAAFEGKLYKAMANYMKNANIEIEHLTVKRKNANYFALVPMIVSLIVAGFLMVNVALGLFGILWYNINRRRGEIGLRRAVGASGKSVSTQLVTEALLLATLAIIAGSFFAVQFPLMNVFDLSSSVYFTALVWSIVFIYLLVLICSLYPGRQAAAIYPAVALHEE